MPIIAPRLSIGLLFALATSKFPSPEFDVDIVEVPLYDVAVMLVEVPKL